MSLVLIGCLIEQVHSPRRSYRATSNECIDGVEVFSFAPLGLSWSVAISNPGRRYAVEPLRLPWAIFGCPFGAHAMAGHDCDCIMLLRCIARSPQVAFASRVLYSTSRISILICPITWATGRKQL